MGRKDFLSSWADRLASLCPIPALGTDANSAVMLLSVDTCHDKSLCLHTTTLGVFVGFLFGIDDDIVA